MCIVWKGYKVRDFIVETNPQKKELSYILTPETIDFQVRVCVKKSIKKELLNVTTDN